MTTWYWTWQDPVALICAAVGLGVAFLMWRRQQRVGACGHCPLADEHGKKP